MNESRRRRYTQGKRSLERRVTFDEPISTDKKFNPREFILRYRYRFIFALTSLILIYVLFGPPPKFPEEVQFWHDSSYPFKFRDFDILFQDIRRLRSPVKSSPVLLILHGFPTSSYDWKDLIPDLQKKFPRIIIPDFLGFGFSDKPTGHEYSIKEQATMIEELMVYLKVDEVHVLAHDYGDTVLQELIARSIDPAYHLMFRIRSACLTNGGILPSHHKPLMIQKLLTIPVFRVFMAYLSNRFLFNSRLNSVFAPDTRPSSKQLEDIWSIFSFKKGYAAMPEILSYIAERHANKARWVGALKDTNIPLNLIYGPLDPINTPDGFLKNYREKITQSSVSVLKNIGHYPQMEDKRGFIEAYDRFLERVEDEFYVL